MEVGAAINQKRLRVDDWRWWSLAILPAFIVLTALIEMPGVISGLLLQREAAPALLMLQYAECWLYWTALAPLMFWFMCRFPVEGSCWIKRALLHVAATVGFVASHLALHAATDFTRIVTDEYAFVERLTALLRYSAPTEVITFLMIDGAFHAVRFSARARWAAERERELLHLKTVAELEALRRRLQPHFLFNALNSLCAMLPERDNARQMATRLSDYLRLTLNRASKEMVSLREEMALLHAYLEVESVRHGDRLATRFSISEDVLDAPTPVLVLQPLVENAVKFATAGVEDVGEVTLDAHRRNGALVLRVTNSISDGAPPTGENQGHAIIRERLAANYGAGAALRTDRSGGRYVAEITLPLEARA